MYVAAVVVISVNVSVTVQLITQQIYYNFCFFFSFFVQCEEGRGEDEERRRKRGSCIESEKVIESLKEIRDASARVERDKERERERT